MTHQDSEYRDCEQLIRVFAEVFYDRYRTRLVRGGDEPLYLPASITGGDHQIIFARGFFTSALHELAHWCVAGEKRRQLEDFGYWYLPDGRTPEQQREFEKVEVLPQAYEHCFTLASRRRFHISADNLSGNPGDTRGFERQVYRLTQQFLEQESLLGRAGELFNALCTAWQHPFSQWKEEALEGIRERLLALDDLAVS
ncbi:elongation factor P hydroxylase [Marinospirillum perlucidum]|uniref:elongation factor P hydroxylase n=1 Tax=Marinospirillum perlucidum TaxID=1982602 RepID=UPI000DF195AB|nr:elongation factor P hydroxylase [Marinospirillum perlucidum]